MYFRVVETKSEISHNRTTFPSTTHGNRQLPKTEGQVHRRIELIMSAATRAVRVAFGIGGVESSTEKSMANIERSSLAARL